MSYSQIARRSFIGGTIAAGATVLLSQTASAATPFIDVPSSHQFATEINWMYTSKLSSGWKTSQGREYRPNLAINRDAMATFLYRYAGSPSYTAPAKSPFADVSVSHPFYREICWLYSQKISTGWGTGTSREFRPNSTVKRDAMATFLYRFAGSPAHTPAASSPFKDVPVSHPFYKEMHWLYTKEISTGWGTGTSREFRPSDDVRRDAMAAFLHRFQGVRKLGTSSDSTTETSNFPQEVARETLVLVNQERAKVGAKALKANTALQTVAQNWSVNMAQVDNLYHNPSYTQQYPAGWRAAAENVAQNWGVDSPQQMASMLVTQWMNSPGHRQNILNSTLTDYGFGLAFVTGSKKVYATQNFAQY
ncbi:MAG: S-layer homology domain-containing protein [Rothia sp. (in: high G+C Gram-positive bacteria)]|nr:S-layer homology domain-containing protein [Rothia sp. (in: high G+C Gram-positive bacteria)]